MQSEDCEDWLHLGIRASSSALGFLRPYGNKRPRSSGTIFVGKKLQNHERMKQKTHYSEALAYLRDYCL
ncbi:MAG: hypothetical protein J6Y14_05565, partial [Fibrobacter sp.]|nr:hypothetical protein [Fibrobacter sp.]